MRFAASRRAARRRLRRDRSPEFANAIGSRKAASSAMRSSAEADVFTGYSYVDPAGGSDAGSAPLVPEPERYAAVWRASREPPEASLVVSGPTAHPADARHVAPAGCRRRARRPSWAG